MTAKKNPAASVKQRLLNLGRKSGEDFRQLLTRYAIERLLFRLAGSEHADDFVLNGAMLFALWTGEMHRPTRDVDLLGYGENSDARRAAVFRDLCAGESGDDGLAFDAGSVSVEQIREEDDCGGRRVTFAVRLGQARVSLQVDVGFGDAVTPAAEVVEYPSLLGMETPRLRAYPKEAVVAEKVEAMVKLGLANTRMKDFYDLLVLSRTFTFDGALVRAAIAATFRRRGTAIPTESPVALTDTFATDNGKRKQWKAFVRRSGLEEKVGELDDVVAELVQFVLPPLLAAGGGESFDETWPTNGPWC